MIDHGLLRILGSGHPRLPRDIVGWNAGRSSGHLLVADDLLGRFFAIDTGALGQDPGAMHHFAPDALQWEAMEIGYSDFLHGATSDRPGIFYGGMRWADWETDAQQAGGNHCFSFFPFLSTAEGSVERSSRTLVDIAEHYTLGAQLSDHAAHAGADERARNRIRQPCLPARDAHCAPRIGSASDKVATTCITHGRLAGRPAKKA
nr:DUF2625 family protein [Xanthomonas sacchari]